MGAKRRGRGPRYPASHDHEACHRRIAELEQQVATLQALVARLEAEVRDLRARLGLNSTNSHKPPSSDAPSSPPRPAKPSTGRPPGAQPGHEGVTRSLLPVGQVEKVVPVVPKRCRGCHRVLAEAPGAADPLPLRHQVTDVPPFVAKVTEYRLEGRLCECGVITHASLPSGVPSGVIGPRLQAITSLLTGRYHLSRRDVVEAVDVLFGAEVSLGTIVDLEAKTAAVLEQPYREVAAAVRAAPVVHADETSWRQRRKRMWLWIAVTVAHALFRLDPNRSREAFERLLGDFEGILVTDRWSAYDHLPLEQRQICWAHLKRDFKKVLDRGGPAAEIGQAGLDLVERIFEPWHAFKRAEIDRQRLGLQLVPVKERLRAILDRGATNEDHKTAAFCGNLSKLWPALWTFAEREGVEPTNNDAERPLRPGVIWRKISFGCHSPGGCRFVERILTTVATLRKQRRSVLDFLEAAIRTRLRRRAPPSLLAVPSG